MPPAGYSPSPASLKFAPTFASSSSQHRPPSCAYQSSTPSNNKSITQSPSPSPIPPAGCAANQYAYFSISLIATARPRIARAHPAIAHRHHARHSTTHHQLHSAQATPPITPIQGINRRSSSLAHIARPRQQSPSLTTRPPPPPPLPTIRRPVARHIINPPHRRHHRPAGQQPSPFQPKSPIIASA